MINWKDQKERVNPIQSHIEIKFEWLLDENGADSHIVNDLETNKFDESKSSVLIFAHSRKKTEELATLINERLKESSVKYRSAAAYFHAGLDAISRRETYEQFKTGKISILVATKAFGMGMDIKNIHFLYHLGPSSTFEDFLQEVGRAGRDKESREASGFSEKNPIQAKCLLAPDAFEKLKDRQHRNQITWGQVLQIRESIFDYIKKFRPLTQDDGNSFPLPLDLLEIIQGFTDIKGKDILFKLALYWLEKLDRIKLGAYVPTHLPFLLKDENINFKKINNVQDRDRLIKLQNILKNVRAVQDESIKEIMVSTESLKEQLNCKRQSELYRLIFLAQNAKICELNRSISLQPTKRKYQELNAWMSTSSATLPVIEALFGLTLKLFSRCEPQTETTISSKEFESLIEEISPYYFQNEKIYWHNHSQNPEDNQKKSEELIKEFKEKRAFLAFRILGFLPKVKHNSIIHHKRSNHKEIVQAIYNGSKNKNETIKEIADFKKRLISLLRYVFNENNKKPGENLNYVNIINKIGLSEEPSAVTYLDKLINIGVMTGYIKGEGKFIPLGVELFIKSLSDIDIEETDSLDERIYKEFAEISKIKEARSLALKALSELIDKRQDTDQFIKEYFQCSNLQDFVLLLENYLGENSNDLRAFRDEALKEEVLKLNENQKVVYNIPLDKNIQVIAGPGSGKTHTLILRVARLIHEEKIDPENILVLAYNKAVVIELKDRLKQLFAKLGYARLTQRLKVFTFHGFIKYCLADEIENRPFDQWTSTFLSFTHTARGMINLRTGLLKYVFVDEFQDITTERMDVLRYLVQTKDTKICVIGDPNQSIYGYQRADKGDPINPEKYYIDFKKLFLPVELSLNINYRSYDDIIYAAEELLRKNRSTFNLGKITAFNKNPSITEKSCLIIDDPTRLKWPEILKNLVENPADITDIALMFRSNAEVYQAFNIVKNLQLKNIRLRIQGTKAELYKTREFHHLLCQMEKKRNEKLPSDFLQRAKKYKEECLGKHPTWDNYNLNIFLCLISEFEKERTEDSLYKDLIDFIIELASGDDGQYGKIYNQHIANIDLTAEKEEIEVVFTTMHKVKGLEFDAVIIPPSFSPFPYMESAVAMQELVEEERRLYYVAYTRAKKKLFVFKDDREFSVDAGKEYKLSKEDSNSLGIRIDEGINKLTLYWNASYGSSSFKHIEEMRIGDPIILEKENYRTYTFWYVKHNNTKVAQLSKETSRKLGQADKVSDLVVSSIYVRTFEEETFSDDRNNRTGEYRFSVKWNPEARNRGYIYLIDFAGYGKIQTKN